MHYSRNPIYEWSERSQALFPLAERFDVSGFTYIAGMPTKKRRRSIKLLVCPGCGQVGTLRTILYGMPDPEVFDFEKYAVGGCCMNGDGSDPDIRCKSCDWEGLRDQQLSL